MKDALHLTPAEFEIVEILWNSSTRLSVGQVLKRIQRRRKVAYTTIMTLLDKMARKGSVRRVKKGKAYLYAPAVERARVRAYLLEDFAASYFDGDVRQIARFLNANRDPSQRSVRPSGMETPVAPASRELDVTLL